MGVKYQYTVDLIAQTKQFEQNMQKATSEAKRFAGEAGNVNSSGTKLSESFGLMGKGLGKLAIMIGGPTAALSLLKSSVEAIEGPGDRLEEVVSGGKEALFEFQRALATVDFSNFIENLIEGYKRGKDFAAAMDAFSEKGAYSNFIIAGLKEQSSALRETIRNYDLDISVRKKASDDRIAIELDIQGRTKAIAQEELDIIQGNWESRNKVTFEAAQKAYEIALTFSDAEVDALEQNEKYKGNNLAGFTRAQLDALNSISQGRKDAFATMLLLDKGEKDVIVKLFNTKQKYNDTATAANDRYSFSVRENSMLLVKQENALARLTDTAIEFKRATAPDKVGISALSSIGDASKLRGLPKELNLGGISEADADLKAFAESLGILSKLDDPFKFMQDSLKGLTDNLLKGADSFKEYSKNVVGSVKEIVGALLAESIATSIATALKAAKFAGPAGVFLIPALAALGGGLAKTAFNSMIPGFAEGGLVSGPTLGLMGEYPGARGNPEVIAPLSKLERMLKPALSEGSVTFRIGDRELIGVLERYGRVHQNIRGKR